LKVLHAEWEEERFKRKKRGLKGKVKKFKIKKKEGQRKKPKTLFFSLSSFKLLVSEERGVGGKRKTFEDFKEKGSKEPISRQSRSVLKQGSFGNERYSLLI